MLTHEQIVDIKRRHEIYDEKRARAPSNDDYMHAFVAHMHRRDLLAHIDELNAEIAILREQDWRPKNRSDAT